MTINSLKSKRTPANAIKRPDTNAKSLSFQIRKLALECGPSAKLPTARELCASLGTTRATLHSALGELEAQNVICRKQGSGIYVSPKLHRKAVTIALNASLFSGNMGASPFWGILLGRLVAEAQKRSAVTEQDYHFHLVTEQDAGWEENLIKNLENNKLHGVLMIGFSSGTLFARAEADDLAVVSYAASGRWQVVVELNEMVELGADVLLEQGCQKIGLWRPVDPVWAPDYEESIWEHRIELFKAKLVEGNRRFYPELVKDYRHLLTVPNADPREIHQAQGYCIAMEVFGGSEPIKPDGVLCADDLMTVGALAALQHLGLKVGEDLKIATHSNIGSRVLYGHEDKMTLIDSDPAAITSTLFDTLEKVIAGERPTERLVPVSQTVRGYTGSTSGQNCLPVPVTNS